MDSSNVYYYEYFENNECVYRLFYYKNVLSIFYAEDWRTGFKKSFDEYPEAVFLLKPTDSKWVKDYIISLYKENKFIDG